MKILIVDEFISGKLIKFSPDNYEKKIDHFFKLANIICDINDSLVYEKDYLICGASFHDFYNLGYEEYYRRINKKYGDFDIEVHAYSSSGLSCETKLLDEFHVHSIENGNRTIKLCAAGHDLNHLRFPANCPSIFSVGVKIGNSSSGSCDLFNFRPDFILDNLEYEAYDIKNNHTSKIKGSSAAVAWLAGLLLKFSYLQKNKSNYPVQSCMAACFPYKEKNDFNFFKKKKELYTKVHNTEKLKFSLITISIKEIRENGSVSIYVPRLHAKLFSQNYAKIKIRNKEYKKGSCILNLDEHFINGICEIEILGIFNRVIISSFDVEFSSKIKRSEKNKKDEDIVILGVSASHDASACITVNGELKRATQLERVSRIKRDGSSVIESSEAMKYCLDSLGYDFDDIDFIGFNSQNLIPEYVGLSNSICSDKFKFFDPFSKNVFYVSHHLSHAFAGFSGSKFQESKVVVCDGSGGSVVGEDDLILNGRDLKKYITSGLNGEKPYLHTFSVYKFSEKSYSLENRECSPSFNVRSGSSSVGEMYASASNYVFGSWHASGKLMGLSSYGNSKINFLSNEVNDTISYEWKIDYKKKIVDDPLDYSNFAATIQKTLEDSLKSKFTKYLTEKSNVVYTGGVALNSVANSKISNLDCVGNLYMLPAQNDAGVAIGAASAVYYEMTGKIKNDAFKNDYLGHVYSLEDVYRDLSFYKPKLRIKNTTSEEIAKNISKGSVYGFFSLSLGSEFGPRALGSRSIIADPRSIKTWKFINKWIKYREEFRPFAPIVKYESACKFFEINENCDYSYMLHVVKVRKKYRNVLQAITHVDGTARIQLITKKSNEKIYNILDSFEKETGIPILLNTSFNVRGMPIVEKPLHAIEMLLSTSLSGVIFENIIAEVKNFSNLSNIKKISLSPGTSYLKSYKNNLNKIYLSVKNQGKNIEISKCVSPILESLLDGRSISSLADNEKKIVLPKIKNMEKLRYINFE